MIASVRIEFITPDKYGRKWVFDFRPEGIIEEDIKTWEYLNRYLSIIMGGEPSSES